jgi:hypothetical protein
LQILGAETDDFDAAEFDTVDYINRHFPDEKSLDGIDRQVAAMDAEIRDLDESILGAPGAGPLSSSWRLACRLLRAARPARR